MKYAVLGLGISGLAVAKFLLEKGESVIGIDCKERLFQITISHTHFSLCDENSVHESFDTLVVSPGVPPSHPLYRWAKERQIPILGEIELALRHMNHRVIGVTGTNGKTTTVMQLAHVLNDCGYTARVAGNIGKPLIEQIEAPEETIFALELSSYQIETMSTPCLDAAVVLNVTPDHLERYASFEEYKNTKMHLLNLAPKERALDHSVLNDNFRSLCALLSFYGVSEAQCKESLKTFKPAPHRTELIKEIDEILFYNDSKGTNVASVMYAVSKIKAPKIMLVGGKDKQVPFSPWKEGFQKSVKSVIAFGESKAKIASDLKGAFEVIQVDTLKDAVKMAILQAEKKDAVVLSPGCSSFDQFRNYEERGECFKNIVEECYES